MPGGGHERRSRAGTRAGTALVAPTWRHPWLLLAALAISLAGIVDRLRALPQVEMVGMNLRAWKAGEAWRAVARVAESGPGKCLSSAKYGAIWCVLCSRAVSLPPGGQRYTQSRGVSIS